MIGSQTTRPRCSHLKLDDVATPACLFVLLSVALYASVYACVSLCARQTDHPQTVGTLLAEKGSERREGDGCAALNTCDIPIPIQRSVFGAVPLAMQAYLYVVYGQR